MIGDKIIEEFETDDALAEVVARRNGAVLFRYQGDESPVFELSAASAARLTQALLQLRQGDGA